MPTPRPRRLRTLPTPPVGRTSLQDESSCRSANLWTVPIEEVKSCSIAERIMALNLSVRETEQSAQSHQKRLRSERVQDRLGWTVWNLSSRQEEYWLVAGYEPHYPKPLILLGASENWWAVQDSLPNNLRNP